MKTHERLCPIRRGCAGVVGILLACWPWACLHSQSSLREDAIDTMHRAASYFRNQVATHGGYVYHYSLDLSERWGEGLASPDQIWVQPPGTPTVGMAYLRAYEATGDPFYRDAALEAGLALVYGQLESGGWTNLVDFDPTSERAAMYRNGKGKGKNNSSLDDGQTQSAIQLLVQLDDAMEQQHQAIHEAATVALEALLAAQFPNGGFPQVWTGPVDPRPVLPANYPDYDWRTEGRIKNYWDMYTLNDNVTGNVADVLMDAYQVYGDEKYRTALEKLGDFLLLAQMPQPQPGWAQQYNVVMQPIWARKFEPPGVSGDETQEVIETLLAIAHFTGDRRYLTPIPAALAWLQRSRLADGRLARYYELITNRPLYMSRRGDRYSLTYDDENLPSHYGWKSESRIDQLRKSFQRVRAGKPPIPPPSRKQVLHRASAAINALDGDDRWISTFGGQRLVGQAKMAVGEKYLSSQVFSDNLRALSDLVGSSH